MLKNLILRSIEDPCRDDVAMTCHISSLHELALN